MNDNNITSLALKRRRCSHWNNERESVKTWIWWRVRLHLSPPVFPSVFFLENTSRIIRQKSRSTWFWPQLCRWLTQLHSWLKWHELFWTSDKRNMWLHIFIVYLISKATSHMCFLFGTWSLFLVFALKNIFQTSYWIADKNVQVPKRNYKLNGWVTERQWDSQVHQFHLSLQFGPNDSNIQL